MKTIIIDNSPETNHFLNLVCDFPEQVTNKLNPLFWSLDERKDFITRVQENSPKKFKQFGYQMLNGKLYWSVTNLK